MSAVQQKINLSRRESIMRNIIAKSSVLALAFVFALPWSARSEEAQRPAAEAKKPDPLPQKKISYTPPKLGAPKVRVDGGTRGDDQTLPSLSVLAPDHVGLTTREQPALFWFQSTPAKVRFELTLLEENKNEPLVEVKVEDSSSGIQRLDLAERKVKLSPDVSYEWTVALVTDPSNRSKDIIASGVIRRVQPSAELQAKLSKATKADLPFIYAEEGIWYDAVGALAEQIQAEPSNKALHAVRASLLSQVGLSDAANHETKLASAH
jgi:hypothetical protein